MRVKKAKSTKKVITKRTTISTMLPNNQQRMEKTSSRALKRRREEAIVRELPDVEAAVEPEVALEADILTPKAVSPEREDQEETAMITRVTRSRPRLL